MENNPASLLVFLGKVFNGMPPLLCGRQIAQHLENGNSQASADMPSKRKQFNLLFREWKINMKPNPSVLQCILKNI